MKITSVNNDLIKETSKLLRGKYRDERRLFLIEGEKGILEAIEADVKIERIFIQETFVSDILKQVRNDNVIEVTESVMAKISDAKTPPKAIAVAKQLNCEWSDAYTRVILLEGIKDAGNLGTIIRTASAFGMDAIVLYGDTVDLYNPKCVRSAVGNLWKVPVFKMTDLSLFSEYERIATLPKCDKTILLSEYTPSEKLLIMFGSEADGLSNDLKQFATKNVTIEMQENVESLNLSVSAAIAMYKLRK